MVKKHREKPRVVIGHVDDIYGKHPTPDGWYRSPAESGLGWVYIRNGIKTSTVAGSDKGRGYELWELWVGDDETGDTETISYHRKWTATENAAEKWIRAHPKGWV